MGSAAGEQREGASQLAWQRTNKLSEYVRLLSSRLLTVFVQLILLDFR
jgi:hypothetical protein